MNEESREYAFKSILNFIAVEWQIYDRHEAKGVVNYRYLTCPRIGENETNGFEDELAELATIGGRYLSSVSFLMKNSKDSLINMVLRKHTDKTRA